MPKKLEKEYDELLDRIFREGSLDIRTPNPQKLKRALSKSKHTRSIWPNKKLVYSLSDCNAIQFDENDNPYYVLTVVVVSAKPKTKYRSLPL